MEDKPAILIHVDALELITKLDMWQRGEVITCILAHAMGGQLPAPETIPELDSCADIVYTALQSQIDREHARYVERCTKRKEAANARWEKERKKNKFFTHMQRNEVADVSKFILNLDDNEKN